jgi:hypothetical protein
MTGRSGGILAVAALAALLSPGSVQADPDETIPCVLGLIKAPPAAAGQGLTKFVCKGSFTLPSAGAAPGDLDFDVNVDPPGTSNAGFVFGCSGLGSPAGSKGYKCKTNLALVLIKANLIKGVVKVDFPLVGHENPHPFVPDSIRVKLTTSGPTNTKNYCARFTSPLTNSATLYKSKTAPAPSACSPSGAFLTQDGGLV